MAFEFGCKTAGSAYNWKARGATEDEVLARVVEHARKKHKVKTATGTIASYLKSTLRQV